jgi:hypothetical protein
MKGNRAGQVPDSRCEFEVSPPLLILVRLSLSALFALSARFAHIDSPARGFVRLHCYHIMFLSHFRMPSSPAPYREQSAPYQSQAMTRPRYLTLAYEDMETIKTLPPTFAVSIYQSCEITDGFHYPVLRKLIAAVMVSQEAEALAREWINPPPGATFLLRVPVEYASVQASRLLHGGSLTPEHCRTPRYRLLSEFTLILPLRTVPMDQRGGHVSACSDNVRSTYGNCHRRASSGRRGRGPPAAVSIMQHAARRQLMGADRTCYTGLLPRC